MRLGVTGVTGVQKAARGPKIFQKAADQKAAEIPDGCIFSFSGQNPLFSGFFPGASGCSHLDKLWFAVIRRIGPRATKLRSLITESEQKMPESHEVTVKFVSTKLDRRTSGGLKFETQ